jgi:Domain of unknown function (DUF1844)
VSDQESESGFTFVDRRRRDDEATTSARPAAAPTTPLPPRADPAPAPAGEPARADFGSFCVMLYSEALMHLGQVPDPMTGEPHRDLEQAQFTIELLAMLQQKTEGNRTPEESGVLEEILAALRMAYVRASRLT